MSNKNNENNSNIEQEQKTNKNWWKKLLGLNPTYKLTILFIFIFVLIFSNNICYAGSIPKFNPKNPNPKPGLYKLDRMHNRRYHHQMTILKDGKVFISGTDTNFSDDKGYKTAEIFDIETGKFKKVNTLYSHNILGHKSVLMNNGNVLLSCGYEEKVTVVDLIMSPEPKGRYEIYDTATNKFYPGPKSNLSCKRSVFLKNSNDGNIIAYGEAEVDGKIKTVFEKYDVKSNTVSDITKYNTSDYDPYFHKVKNSDKMFPLVEEAIGHPRYCIAFFDGCYLFSANKQVDYGTKINDIRYMSWFSPLYIVNEKEINISKINEYSRSFNPKGTKLQGKNMILITGGLYPLFLLYNPDVDPKDIPLKARIFKTGGNASRSAYIFVY